MQTRSEVLAQSC